MLLYIIKLMIGIEYKNEFNKKNKSRTLGPILLTSAVMPRG